MIKQDLYNDMIASMKRKDKVQTAIYRIINAEIKNEEVKQKCKDLSDQDVVVILRKLQKQMEESLEAFQKVYNENRVNELRQYLVVILTYLPKQLNEDQLKDIIFNILKETNNSAKNIGEAMKLVMPKVKGLADGKIIKEIVEGMMK